MGVGLLVAEEDAEQCVGGDCSGGPGEQAPEGVRAVAGQFHLNGDLAEGGLDAVAPLGNDLQQDRRRGRAVLLAWRDEDGGAAGGLGCGERPAVEALVREQVTRGGPGFQQVAGDLALDPAARVVTVAGEPVDLTRREFRLLEYLMTHADRAVSKTELLEHVWDVGPDGDPNVVQVYVGYLRRKLGRDAIRTVRGSGFAVRS